MTDAPAYGGGEGGGKAGRIKAAGETNSLEKVDETNNTLALTVDIGAPDVDPAISNLQVPSEGVAQGEVLFSYTVMNSGSDAAKASGGWSDALYLSKDAILDSEDAQVGSYWAGSHALLGAGETYDASGSVRLDTSELTPGDWYLIADVTGEEAQYETSRENSALAAPIRILASDLAITATDVPAEVNLDSTFSVSWIVVNQGDAPALGRGGWLWSKWVDGAYLSTDIVLHFTDTLLANRSSYQVLDVGGNYSNSASIQVQRSSMH